MTPKRIVMLLAALVIVGAAWKISEQKAPQTEIARSAFFPGLMEQLNDVARVTLESGDDLTTLVRDGDAWAIENKDGFAASPGEVRRTLLQIASLSRVEAKTRSPERYGRIGVADPGAAEGAGTRVSGSDAAGEPVFALIVGNARDGAPRPQHYLREVGAEQAWLAEGALEVPADPVRWLDAGIVDVDTERVREVRITAADATPIVIAKDEADDSFFTLRDIPPGFEAKSKATVSSLGALLLDLRLNDVLSAERVAGQQPVREAVVRTFDGLVATLAQYDLDGEPYVGFTFAFDAASVTAAPATEDDAAADEAQESDDDTTDAGEPAETVAEEAARLAARTAGWIYALPNYKQRMLARDFDSLVEPVKETSGETAGDTGEDAG